MANEILQRLARPILSGKCLEFAIDIHYIPYHGKPKKDDDEIVRSKAKSGTTHFHAYATLYVIVLGKRFTLADYRNKLNVYISAILIYQLMDSLKVAVFISLNEK
jgi:hypothetical protein